MCAKHPSVRVAVDAPTHTTTTGAFPKLKKWARAQIRFLGSDFLGFGFGALGTKNIFMGFP